jgi:hypothetical protein
MASLNGHESISMREWESMPLDAKRFLARSRDMLLSDLETQVQLANALVSSSNLQNHVLQAARAATAAAAVSAAAPSSPAPRLRTVRATSSQSDDDAVATAAPVVPAAQSGLLPAVMPSTHAEETDRRAPLPVSTAPSAPEENQGVVKYAATDFFGLRGLRSKDVVVALEEANESEEEGGEGGAGEVATAAPKPTGLLRLPSRAAAAKGAHRGGPEDEAAPVLQLLPDLLLAVLGFVDGDALGYALMTQLGTAALRAHGRQGHGDGHHGGRHHEGGGEHHGGSHGSASALVPVADGLFRGLCERTYLAQSRRKVVDPRRWGGWRSMWLRRPRVRTNGFYCMASVRPRSAAGCFLLSALYCSRCCCR